MKIDKSIYKKDPKIKKMEWGTQGYDNSYVIDPNKSDVNNQAAKRNFELTNKNQDNTTNVKTGVSAVGTGVGAVVPWLGAVIHGANAMDSVGRKIPGATDERGYANRKSFSGKVGTAFSPIEHIKNLSSGNANDTFTGAMGLVGGGGMSMGYQMLGGDKLTQKMFGKSSADKAKDEYDQQMKMQGQLQNFMYQKVDDNYAMAKKNREEKQIATWGRQNTSSGPVIAKTGMKGYKCKNGSSSIKPKSFGVIEIEGKNGIGEIHTDETMRQVKAIGVAPHYAGGTKSIAKEGDVVFNTQGKPQKYKKIITAIAEGDQETLERERKKIPGDSGEKMKKGTDKFVLDKKGYRSTVDKHGHTYVKTPEGKYLYKPKGANDFREEKTSKSINSIDAMESRFKGGKISSPTSIPSASGNSVKKSEFNVSANEDIIYDNSQGKTKDEIDDMRTNDERASAKMDFDADKVSEWSDEKRGKAVYHGTQKGGKSNKPGYKFDNQKIKDLVGAGAEVVPILHNLTQKPVMPNERGKLYSRMNKFISTKPLEDAVTADTYAANKHNAVEMSGGNASNARANAIAANETARMQRAGTIANDNQRYSEIQNANNALRNQDAAFNYEQDFLNQREKYQVRSQKQEQITKAMSQIGELGARSKERVAQQNFNKEYLDAVKEGYDVKGLNQSLAPKEKGGNKSVRFGYKKK